MQRSRQISKVEVKGFTARYYDALLNIASFGNYSSFIEKSIKLLGIMPEDKILDFGAGTGRNACLMMKYLSSEGKIVGIDISKEMISQFRKKCSDFPNTNIIKSRIDEPLPFKEEFDKVFISFVFHGFPQSKREVIIKNSFKALKGGGSFLILDYNKFSFNNSPFYVKIFFKFIECPYAFDFIKRDWKKILSSYGFGEFEEYFFFGKYVRLLKAVKMESKNG